MWWQLFHCLYWLQFEFFLFKNTVSYIIYHDFLYNSSYKIICICSSSSSSSSYVVVVCSIDYCQSTVSTITILIILICISILIQSLCPSHVKTISSPSLIFILLKMEMAELWMSNSNSNRSEAYKLHFTSLHYPTQEQRL